MNIGNKLYDVGLGIYQDFTKKDAILSCQAQVVKTFEVVYDTMKAVDEAMITPGLRDLKGSCTLLRGFMGSFDMFSAVESLSSAIVKLSYAVFEGTDYVAQSSFSIASGALIALASGVSKTCKNVVDIWQALAKFDFVDKIPNTFVVLNQGWGTVVGGVSRILTSGYCFMNPETEVKDFGDLNSVKNGPKSPLTDNGKILQARVKAGCEVVDGVFLSALGSMSLFVKNASLPTILACRIGSLTSQIGARYLPRIANTLFAS